MNQTSKRTFAMFEDVSNVTSYSIGEVITYGSPKVKAKSRGLAKARGGKPVVYLVDADTHAYRAAAATDGSQWEVVDNVGKIHVFKYKKEADAFTQTLIHPYHISQRWYPEPESHALKLLEDSLEIFKDCKVEYYVTGKSNFRYDIISNYKGNRKGRRPANLSVCKQALLNKGAKLDENLEADDLVIIRAKQLDKLGVPWVIVGCDKDLLQIKGRFYDPFKKKFTTITNAEARRNLWKQIAVGDSTDNIVSPRGLGPKTFDKYFKDYDWDKGDDFSALQKMVGLYKTKVKKKDGESDEEYLTRILMWIKTVASLVFLRRGADEPYQLPTKEGTIERSR